MSGRAQSVALEVWLPEADQGLQEMEAVAVNLALPQSVESVGVPHHHADARLAARQSAMAVSGEDPQDQSRVGAAEERPSVGEPVPAGSRSPLALAEQVVSSKRVAVGAEPSIQGVADLEVMTRWGAVPITQEDHPSHPARLLVELVTLDTGLVGSMLLQARSLDSGVELLGVPDTGVVELMLPPVTCVDSGVWGLDGERHQEFLQGDGSLGVPLEN